MGNDEVQNIGVKKETLKFANEEIHYGCRPNDWQMFEILVSFCKDCPDVFNDWKNTKLEKLKEKWQMKKTQKIKKSKK